MAKQTSGAVPRHPEANPSPHGADAGLNRAAPSRMPALERRKTRRPSFHCLDLVVALVAAMA